MRIAIRLISLLTLCSLPVLGAQTIPSPRDVIGFEVGADKSLADWHQILGYFTKLAAATPSVRMDTLGPTTMGKPFVLVTVSSPENMRRLESIRAAQARLADPRGLAEADEARLEAGQPSVVLISCNIHSDEIASSQMAMQLAYRLVTDDSLKKQLANTVVLLIPSMNPDGEQMIVEWYKKNLGTQWEGGPLPWLYQKYVGHDNNRDFFMVTQQETKLVTALLYKRWFPEVFYDVHQMGAEGARLFVPPFLDPMDPNIDPLIIRGIAQIGAEMAMALESKGKSGVVDRAIYDVWWNGGARSTPTRHNMIGLLTEAASVKIASPITQTSKDLTGHERGLPRYEQTVSFPNPWPPGVWRLRDIVDYELIAAEALIRLAAQDRTDYVRNFVALGRRQLALAEKDSIKAYIIPRVQRDAYATSRLLEVLHEGGVEVKEQENGWIVPMAQPYRAHAKDLLEIQHYPKRELWPGGPPDPPYDVTGWTLPLQMGVRAIALDSMPHLDEKFAAMIGGGGNVRTAFVGGRVYRAFSASDSRAYLEATRALKNGGTVRVTRGDVLVELRAPTRRGGPGQRTGGNAGRPSGAGAPPQGPPPGEAPGAVGQGPAMARIPGEAGVMLLHIPRIGLYKPWTANIDEGWTRWVLEQFEFPYTTLTDSAVKAGKLRDHYDALIVSDMSLRELRDGMPASDVPPPYAGGLGRSGIEALAAFVRGGGTLVLLDHASELATDALGVQVKRITVSRKLDENGGGEAADQQHESLYAPGSILRVLVDGSQSTAFGMPDTAAVYFTNSVTFDVPAGSPVRVIARYPERAEDILLSGYLQGAQAIAGKAAAVEASVGGGRVIMFGFRPQHRGQSYLTFRMLFNALLTSGGQRATP